MGKNQEFDSIPMLDLTVTQTKSYLDSATPKTRSTNGSSQGSYCNSDEEDACDVSGFDHLIKLELANLKSDTDYNGRGANRKFFKAGKYSCR